MRAIALIQNQSEMAHYGYADCRDFLSEFGYKVTLYTAQNADKLAGDLRHASFDSVVFSSNALNDKTIRTVVYSLPFRDSLSEFLRAGNGALVLHQLRIAQQAGKGETDGLLSFLPCTHPPRLMVRPPDESSNLGHLSEQS